MEWPYEILASKDIRGLPRRLIVAVPKKTLLVDEKRNRNERFWNI